MKSLYKFIGIPAAFLALQSCFVAKDYERPDEDEVVEEAYFRTDSLSRDSTNMAEEVSWEEMFRDPVLRKYISKGLKNNIDIRIAVKDIEAAEAYVKQGKAGFYPTLNGNANATRDYYSKNSQQGRTMPTGTKDHFDQFEVSGDLSWEADIWGKIRSRKRAADASYLQTVAAHKGVKTQLIASIASSYYQLLTLDKQIEVTEETVENRKESFETTKALKEAGGGEGNVNSAAVERTRAQYIDAKGILVNLKKQTRILENGLFILLGEEPHGDLKRSSLDDQEVVTDLKYGVPSQLLYNRPDVIAAEQNYRNAFEMTNAARADFYPSVTIGASGGLRAMDFGNLWDSNSLFANLTAGLTAPIFNGRQIRTEYEVSQVEQDQAMLNFRGALMDASKDVSDALYSYNAAKQTVDIKDSEFTSLESALEDSKALFNNGRANYLEVLTAQEDALNTRLDMIDARYDKLNSMVNLYEALGGGWE